MKYSAAISPSFEIIPWNVRVLQPLVLSGRHPKMPVFGLDRCRGLCAQADVGVKIIRYTGELPQPGTWLRNSDVIWPCDASITWRILWISKGLTASWIWHEEVLHQKKKKGLLSHRSRFFWLSYVSHKCTRAYTCSGCLGLFIEPYGVTHTWSYTSSSSLHPSDLTAKH